MINFDILEIENNRLCIGVSVEDNPYYKDVYLKTIKVYSAEGFNTKTPLYPNAVSGQEKLSTTLDRYSNTSYIFEDIKKHYPKLVGFMTETYGEDSSNWWYYAKDYYTIETKPSVWVSTETSSTSSNPKRVSFPGFEIPVYFNSLPSTSFNIYEYIKEGYTSDSYTVEKPIGDVYTRWFSVGTTNPDLVLEVEKMSYPVGYIKFAVKRHNGIEYTNTYLKEGFSLKSSSDYNDLPRFFETSSPSNFAIPAMTLSEGEQVITNVLNPTGGLLVEECGDITTLQAIIALSRKAARNSLDSSDKTTLQKLVQEERYTDVYEVKQKSLVLGGVDLLDTEITKNLFVVEVEVTGIPSPDCPCGLDKSKESKAVYNKRTILKDGMKFFKELSGCTPDREFVDFILRIKALDLSIESCNYLQSAEYWKYFVNAATNNKHNCGCHG